MYVNISYMDGMGMVGHYIEDILKYFGWTDPVHVYSWMSAVLPYESIASPNKSRASDKRRGLRCFFFQVYRDSRT